MPSLGDVFNSILREVREQRMGLLDAFSGSLQGNGAKDGDSFDQVLAQVTAQNLSLDGGDGKGVLSQMGEENGSANPSVVKGSRFDLIQNLLEGVEPNGQVDISGPALQQVQETLGKFGDGLRDLFRLVASFDPKGPIGSKLGTEAASNTHSRGSLGNLTDTIKDIFQNLQLGQGEANLPTGEPAGLIGLYFQHLIATQQLQIGTTSENTSGDPRLALGQGGGISVSDLSVQLSFQEADLRIAGGTSDRIFIHLGSFRMEAKFHGSFTPIPLENILGTKVQDKLVKVLGGTVEGPGSSSNEGPGQTQTVLDPTFKDLATLLIRSNVTRAVLEQFVVSREGKGVAELPGRSMDPIQIGAERSANLFGPASGNLLEMAFKNAGDPVLNQEAHLSHLDNLSRPVPKSSQSHEGAPLQIPDLSRTLSEVGDPKTESRVNFPRPFLRTLNEIPTPVQSSDRTSLPIDPNGVSDVVVNDVIGKRLNNQSNPARWNLTKIEMGGKLTDPMTPSGEHRNLGPAPIRPEIPITNPENHSANGTEPIVISGPSLGRIENPGKVAPEHAFPFGPANVPGMGRNVPETPLQSFESPLEVMDLKPDVKVWNNKGAFADDLNRVSSPTIQVSSEVAESALMGPDAKPLKNAPKNVESTPIDKPIALMVGNRSVQNETTMRPQSPISSWDGPHTTVLSQGPGKQTVLLNGPLSNGVKQPISLGPLTEANGTLKAVKLNEALNGPILSMGNGPDQKDGRKIEVPQNISLASRIEATEIIDRVKEQVSTRVSELRSVSHLSFQLIPESLGTVTVQLVLVDHSVSARIIVTRPEVREALQNNLIDLKTAMNQAGLQIDQLQVQVQSGGGNLLAQYFQYQSENGYSWQNSGSVRINEETINPENAKERAFSDGRKTLLDVFV